MKKFLVFIVLAMALLISPVHAADQSQEANPRIPLIVGIGQSNMAGGYVIPDGTNFPAQDGNIKMMKMDSASVHANPDNPYWSWVNMHEPSSVWGQEKVPNYTDTSEAKFKKYSAATAMMRELKSLKSWTKAGFINCGIGGSAITSWLPGQANFENCWFRIIMAKAYHYEIVGIVFINGETDTNKPVCDSMNRNLSYTENFKTIYNTLVDSEHLNTPNLPLVYVRLGKPSPKPDDFLIQHPCWSNIKYQQTLLNQPATIPYRRMVTTDDLPREEGDGLHYLNPAVYDELGERLAEQMAAAMDAVTP